jgi:hypothetical protein
VASWGEFATEVPEFARAVQERFAAHKHKTLATVRSDGSPRISGTELEIKDGRMWIGAMLGSRRVADLQRDPRLAIHSGSDEPDAWGGDAKVSGVGVFVTDPATKQSVVGEQSPSGDFDLVEIDLTEVTYVHLTPEKDALLVDTWRPGQPVKTFRR